MNKNTTGQDWQTAQQFEQQAQQAAQGEQKAKDFNAHNSDNQTFQQGRWKQSYNTNQQTNLNQNNWYSTTGQQDWPTTQQFEQQAQQAAQGEQKAKEFNARNSDDQNTQQGQWKQF